MLERFQVPIAGDKPKPSAYEYPYIYTWGNNPKRATLKGRRCRVLYRLALNSCVAEFENGQKEIISRNALRRDFEYLG